MNKKIRNIIKKKGKIKIVCLTAYSKNIGKIIDKYCDLILVGDSMANVLYGMKNTHKINLQTIENHSKAVRLGVKKSLLVVDMPKGSYKNPREAKINANQTNQRSHWADTLIDSVLLIADEIHPFIKNR